MSTERTHVDPFEPPDFALVVDAPAANVVLVAVVGDLDRATVPATERCLQDKVRARPEHVIVDLSRTTFFSACGVELLVTTRQLAEDARVGLHLVGVLGNRPVQRVLDLTGVFGLFTFHSTVPGVLATLHPELLEGDHAG